MKRIACCLLLLLSACAPAAVQSGRMLYVEKCAACHGASGRGDGELAAQLLAKPADLTRIAARRGGAWPQEEVMSTVDGYSKRYLPNTDMPIYDDFLEGRLVSYETPSGVRRAPEALVAITRYLETLQESDAP